MPILLQGNQDMIFVYYSTINFLVKFRLFYLGIHLQGLRLLSEVWFNMKLSHPSKASLFIVFLTITSVRSHQQMVSYITTSDACINLPISKKYLLAYSLANTKKKCTYKQKLLNLNNSKCVLSETSWMSICLNIVLQWNFIRMPHAEFCVYSICIIWVLLLCNVTYRLRYIVDCR